MLAAARADASLDFCTVAYGIGVFFLVAEKDERKALALWGEIVHGGNRTRSEWAAFGYIAAEA